MFKSPALAVAVVLAVLGGILFGLFARNRFGTPGRHGAAAFAHTEAILAFGPRPPGSKALDRTRAYLAGQLSGSGWTTRPEEFERSTPVGRTRFVNLRARHGPAEEATWQRPVDLLLGCHIDSKAMPGIEFLGADDAASAAAALIVIAEHVASRHPDRARRIELVFFDGEEAFGDNITALDGLYGSRHYARALRTWETPPRAGVILDMIGHRDLAVRIPSDTPRHLSEALTRAARKAGTSSRFGVAPGPIIDDHVPLNQAGVPTIDLIGDFSSASANWWHTTRDNLHVVDPASLDASIRTTLELIALLLDEE